MTTAPAEPTGPTEPAAEEAESQDLLLQLLDPANRPDPYRICAQFRDRGPVPLA